MESAIFYRWASPDTILVATDLHDAPHLVPHAVAQAKLSRAKVLLVNVIEPSYLRTNPAEGPPFVIPSPALQMVEARLNEIVKQFQQEGVLCEPIALKGLPGEQIPALVHEREVDRVIIGTRAAEGLDRILLGSVADDLLHQMDVPVCVIGPQVRPQVRPDSEPAQILFATSFHHESCQSAQLALEIANLHQSHLTLLHVMSAKYSSESERLQSRKQREDELQSLITDDAKLWSYPAIAVREGDPATEILAEATKLPADLIILGATGASKSSRLLAAGVVHRVVAEARAPVIAVRQEPEVSKERIERLTA